MPIRRASALAFLLLLGTACAARNDGDDVSNVLKGLHDTTTSMNEAFRCADQCVEGATCPDGTIEQFGVCKAGATCCGAPPDMSWLATLDRGPMLVEIDTNASMPSVPGPVRGLFIAYSAGGRWRLQWSCDAETTGEACRFYVNVSAKEIITDIDASTLPADDLEVAETGVAVATTATTDLHELSFSTIPGAEVLVSVLDLDDIHGMHGEPPAVFFTQDSKTNGGFEGRLSNPLRVRPTSP